MENLKDLFSRLENKSFYSKSQFEKFILPLTKKIISKHKKNKTTIIGIQGGQGTGKTTLVIFLKECLTLLGYKVQEFSIDDFYKTYKERMLLSKKFQENPFFQISRGLPGTHRVKYLLKTLSKIKKGYNFNIPVFDKALHNAKGDVLKRTVKVKGRQDFIFFEGWCIGMPTASTKEVLKACKKNSFDLKKIDPALKHTQAVLNLAKEYQLLWKYIDYLIMMQPESGKLHYVWRKKQEADLKKKTGKGMSIKELHKFVDMYLPFTYLCYDKITPDLKLLINKQHRFYRMIKY